NREALLRRCNTPENPRPEMRQPGLTKDLFPRTRFPGPVRKRQIFHRRLATNGLRIELHQAQNIFWHVIPDRQAQFLSALTSNRKVVCPSAAGQQLGQLRRLLSWNLAPEQI